MKTVTTNERGETVTVIGSKSNGRGERVNIEIVEFVCCGSPCFTLRAGEGGHREYRRFSSQVKRAKFIWAHPSNEAVFYV